MKSQIFPFLFLCATASLVSWLLYTAGAEAEDEWNGPSYSWSEMREIYLRKSALEQERQSAIVFRDELAQLKSKLLGSPLPLSDAAETLVSEARRNNPRFLLSLRDRCANASLTTAAALVLVDHLFREGCDNRLTGEQIALVDCLRNELEQFPDMDADTVDRLTIGSDEFYRKARHVDR